MQPIRLTFLGTSASVPTKERGLPAVHISYNGYSILFDCGEGTQRQLTLAGISPTSIDAIFITHLHGDHVFGLPGIINTMLLNNRRKPLYIFLPPTALRRVRWLVHAIPLFPLFPIAWIPVREGTIFEGREFHIEAVRLDHTTETFGYIFREKDRRKLLKDKLEKVGVNDWRIYRRLKAGETVTWNGIELSPEEYTTLVKGRSIGYFVDTAPTYIPPVDYLIHDSAFGEGEREKAEEVKHSTARQAAEVAKKIGAKKLFLYHISPRYRDPTPLLEEAKEVFPYVEVAEDLMTVEL